MSKQAQVGAFAIVAIVLLFLIFYYLSDFGTRHSGYRLGVHFQSAAGLQGGAQVLFSGVPIGTVDQVKLLPDDTVDVILAVNRGVGIPLASRFLIQAPVTGSPSVVIVPPRGGAQPFPTFPPGVAEPVSAQPQGTNAATIADLLQQGQGEIRRLDSILAELQGREPRLLATLQMTLTNANEMTRTLNASIGELAQTLNTDLGSAGANIAQMARTLNSSASLDAPKLDLMMAQLAESSAELHRSMAAIEGLATDPQLRANVVATTASIAQATQTLAQLAADLRTITSNPRTQQQVRDMIANLDATLERANSLLGRIGGRSHVYGVDANATPPPAAPPQPVPQGSAPPQGSPRPLSREERASMGGTLAALARQLVELQVRVGELDAQHVCCPSPLLSADRGPQTDVNAVLFPHGSTSVMFGANDIGHNTTWNLAALHDVAPHVRLGGGVLYSRLGILGTFGANDTGIEARFYDPRRPTLDLYGDVHLTPWAQIFFGERAINQLERRTEYGVQFHY
ncbi:MAG TPA: MlaD family protein [Candidatus Tyrphobacter sp.]